MRILLWIPTTLAALVWLVVVPLIPERREPPVSSPKRPTPTPLPELPQAA